MSQNRKCTICKETKDINDFYKTKYRCKKCMKESIKDNNRKSREWKKKERDLEELINNNNYYYI